MSTVGQAERATQDRVLALFRDELGYRYLGDRTDRHSIINIEQDLLSAWLTRSANAAAQISAANILCEALQRAGPALTTDKVVEALESIHNFDLGVGTTITFGLSEHQGSHKVWATVLNTSGQFQSLDLD